MTIRSLMRSAVHAAERENTERATIGRLESDNTYTFDPPGRAGYVYVTLRSNEQDATVDIVQFRGGNRIGGYPWRFLRRRCTSYDQRFSGC